MEMDATTRRVLEIFRALTPDGQDTLMALTNALLRQQMHEEAERYKAGRMALANATLADVDNGRTAIGKVAIAEYGDKPDILAGLAYTAGIAEGEHRERVRRRNAAMK